MTVTVNAVADRVAVDANDFLADRPLAITVRGNMTETLHRGTLAVVNGAGEIRAHVGDHDQRTFLRSSAKPFQAMALVLTGAADALNLSDSDLAIASASHGGSPTHVAAVRELLARGNVDPAALRCGPHAPLDPEAATSLVSSKQPPTALHNNCSGKHAAMLVTSTLMGWPLDSYLDPSHPLQRLNLTTLSAFMNIPEEEIEIGVDGCGVPAYRAPIHSVATAFARLASGEGLLDEYARAASRIRSAMMNHPFLVAGTKRFDTELMQAGDGTVVCKGGALGGEGIGFTSQGLGMAVKLTDGTNQTLGPICLAGISSLGLLSPTALDQLGQYQQAVIRNHSGTVTGRIETIFSLDSK